MIPFGVFEPVGRTVEELNDIFHGDPVLVFFVGNALKDVFLLGIGEFIG